ncbi:hypothetical protein PEPS_30140 (plasmid) [Persicobacter psychrovividus]|uniref:Uncharacterized protein n=1 Tax=Persicobacter psychrovividus TaxID=387638 RepID=A0ABM7VIY2_9BACT|nr:hypothetical protein PEPS_30140 [Persicobacter psychrovividus]
MNTPKPTTTPKRNSSRLVVSVKVKYFWGEIIDVQVGYFRGPGAKKLCLPLPYDPLDPQ